MCRQREMGRELWAWGHGPVHGPKHGFPLERVRGTPTVPYRVVHVQSVSDQVGHAAQGPVGVNVAVRTSSFSQETSCLVCSS